MHRCPSSSQVHNIQNNQRIAGLFFFLLANFYSSFESRAYSFSYSICTCPRRRGFGGPVGRVGGGAEEDDEEEGRLDALLGCFGPGDFLVDTAAAGFGLIEEGLVFDGDFDGPLFLETREALSSK